MDDPTAPRGREAVHLLERLPLRLPFHVYFELFRRRPFPFLLDSARDPDTLGRFSFMGADPSLVLRARRGAPRRDGPHTARVTVFDGRDASASRPIAEREGDPFEELRRLLAAHAVPRELYVDRPVPLIAGAVGYVGYESGRFLERLPDLGRDDLGLPDLHLGLYDATLACSHRTGDAFLSVLGRGETPASARARAERTRDELLREIARLESRPPLDWAPRPERGRLLTAHAGEDEYCALVRRVKEHILDGDVFEACLTHRIESPFAADAWDLYRELRRVNPAPFACYLGMPEATVVSSSPERFVRLDANGVAESRPIKGTRRRGATEEEDRRSLLDLQSSVKDQAENNMIVDLVRNDFGRVCRFGTVHVPELRVVERYATLYQMVSTIRGELEHGRDAVDLLRACFPGGSMTGAPKIEAMSILARLEPVERGIYSGSIGYLDFAGPMDLNIVIRTFVLKDDRALYGVGGAIVADSEPEAEYQETLDKAQALMTALRNVGG